MQQLGSDCGSEGHVSVVPPTGVSEHECVSESVITSEYQARLAGE